MSKKRCALIPMMLSFFLTSPAFACLESYTSVPITLSGSLKTGELFQKDITQNYYFASGFLDLPVKVPFPGSATAVYFWLVPVGQGWQIEIGPATSMAPDYIATTTLPDRPLLVVSALEPESRAFCFITKPAEYHAVMREVQEERESGLVDIYSAECKAHDEGIGMGIFTSRLAMPQRLEFTADLKIPVLTTDCPAP